MKNGRKLTKNLFVSVDLDPCKFGRHRIPELLDKPIGWLFPNNSILRPLFNHYTMELQESGVFHKLQNHYLPVKSECPSVPFHQIDLGTVTVIFFLFSIGLIFAILTFAAEKYYSHHNPTSERFFVSSFKRKSRSNSI